MLRKILSLVYNIFLLEVYPHNVFLGRQYRVNQGFSSGINKAIAVLTVSKSNWFCITTLHDWLRKFALHFHPIRSKIKTNRNYLARFPALRVSYMYWLRVLIGSVDCLCPLWLARVITWVLRHSVWNRLRFQPWAFRCARDPPKHPWLETK